VLFLAWIALVAVAFETPATLAADTGLPEPIVRISANGQSLRDLAKEIERRSGIAVVVPPSLAGQQITADVKARDWPTALLSLFRQHSTIMAWSPDGRPRRLYLLPPGGDTRDAPPVGNAPGEQRSSYAEEDATPPQGESSFARALREARRRVDDGSGDRGDEAAALGTDSTDDPESNDAAPPELKTFLDALRQSGSSAGSEAGEEGLPGFGSGGDTD
jgi:hypothetical protein